MIPLRIRVDEATDGPPFVVRLRSSGGDYADHEDDAILRSTDGSALEYSTQRGTLRLSGVSASDMDGDVVLVVPQRRIAHRLIRAKSQHNSLLVTERCDQLCVMCSQPPKAKHVDVFPLLERAALLAPLGATIGLTGGEPTLFKDQLFRFLHGVLTARPDLRFHVLTNAQHFDESDAPALRQYSARVLWGIPLYAPAAALHDAIVKKNGAFVRLSASLSVLARAGASIELRTVVMAVNVGVLPTLARLIVGHTPFVSVWAIMQLENIGYGRQNWSSLFVDNSIDFGPIGSAVDIARAHGMSVSLYNFPLCTVPAAYRAYAAVSISDWKRRYLPECDDCALRAGCGGFFEWYPEGNGFARLGLL